MKSDFCLKNILIYRKARKNWFLVKYFVDILYLCDEDFDILKLLFQIIFWFILFHLILILIFIGVNNMKTLFDNLSPWIWQKNTEHFILHLALIINSKYYFYPQYNDLILNVLIHFKVTSIFRYFFLNSLLILLSVHVNYINSINFIVEQ